MSAGMKILDEQQTLERDGTAWLPTATPEISIFLPVYNEDSNLLPRHAKLEEAVKTLHGSVEIVDVDDG